MEAQINYSNTDSILFVISDFLHDLKEIVAILHCYALEYATDRFSRNVGNYQSILRKNPEDRRSPALTSLQM